MTTITYRRYAGDGSDPQATTVGQFLDLEADRIAVSMADGAALALGGEIRLLPTAMHGAEVWVDGIRVATFTVDS